MTAWPAFDTRVNTAVMRAFGEACTLTVLGVEYAITGVFQAPRQARGEGARADRMIGGIHVSQTEPMLSVRSADIADLGDIRNVVAFVRGKNYKIGRVLPDDSGLTAMELREVYP